MNKTVVELIVNETNRLYAARNGVSDLNRLMSLITRHGRLYHTSAERSRRLVASYYSKHLPTRRTFLLAVTEILRYAVGAESVSTAEFLRLRDDIHTDNAVIVLRGAIHGSSPACAGSSGHGSLHAV